MKIRTDFVTNSSSSSFLLGFKDRADGLDQITALAFDISPAAGLTLLEDFANQEPLQKDNVFHYIYDDLENEADYDMRWARSGYGWSSNGSPRDEWLKNHPGKDQFDFYESNEYKDGIRKKVDEYKKELEKEMEGKEYFVLLEYEDHSDIGSELESRVLPNAPFTLRSFSHH